jgi:hypothetical protein
LHRKNCGSFFGLFETRDTVQKQKQRPATPSIAKHPWLAEQFLQSKRQGTRSTKPTVALLRAKKEITMEYLILVAVVSMMALYALIIVGCLKQPEW